MTIQDFNTIAFRLIGIRKDEGSLGNIFDIEQTYRVLEVNLLIHVVNNSPANDFYEKLYEESHFVHSIINKEHYIVFKDIGKRIVVHGGIVRKDNHLKVLVFEINYLNDVFSAKNDPKVGV